jgi:hypothetical protein
MDNELRLWLNVLLLAVRDLLDPSRHPKAAERRLYARLWFVERRTNVGSYHWICHQLGIEPDWLMRRLLTLGERKQGKRQRLVA